MIRSRFTILGSSVSFLLTAAAASAFADERDPGWQLADRSGKGEASLALYVESMPTPGRPAFWLETTFDATPSFVHRIVVEGMLTPDEAPRGQRRKVLERTENGAIVYTFVDLPMMLSDRELALRVVESTDPSTGIHRIEWAEANELLPPVGPDVVRLTGAKGFWEFHPDGQGRTRAIHMTQTEIGGSFPAALGDRLMRSQAVESVESLRDRIARHAQSDVAAGPP